MQRSPGQGLISSSHYNNRMNVASARSTNLFNGHIGFPERKTSMIADSADINFSRLQGHDVIVVGAGAVGIIGALDLCRNNVKVLVLEAGPQWVDAGSQNFFAIAKSTGRNHLGIHNGRFRALGGTTNFWGGQLVRFDSLVFEPRPWIDEYGAWPFRLSDIEEHYDRCESLLNIPGSIRKDESVFPYLDVPAERNDANLQYFFTRWLTEKNFKIRFRSALRQKKNITVVTDATVVAFWADEDGRKVNGVQVKTSEGKTINLNCRILILANGTIEIARLLLQKLADGRKPVWADNAWLGCAFTDHLEGSIGILKPRNMKRFRGLFDNRFVRGMKLQPRLRIARQAQIEQEVLSFALHVTVESKSKERFDHAKIFFRGLLSGRFDGGLSTFPSQLWSAAVLGGPMIWHSLVNNRIVSPDDGNINLRIMLEQQPLKDSKITLADDVDQFGMPVPRLEWKVDGDKEIRTVRIAADLAKRYFESNNIADVLLHDGVRTGKPEILDEFTDTYHHMGTARMALSADQGVVDKDCRVFGTSNLYICGAAVFPSTGFANPTLTAMALALRLSELVTALSGKA
jgi:choline dehydrogenase-like flavoprotein